MITLRIPVAIATAAILSSSTLLHAVDWPEWRGPGGLGHAQATGLPIKWSETSQIAWQTPLPGRGWSSPVIDGNQIWVTAAIETPASPEDIERRMKSNTGDQPLALVAAVELLALCVDRDTGQIRHRIPLIREQEPQWVHTLNSYASPTPFLDDNRLYCHFGTFGTACVDTRSGAVLWTNITLRIMHENGPGSSPLLWKDLVILHLDGSDTQSVAALDRQTGKLAWRTKRSGTLHSNPQLQKNYSTPAIVRIDGRDQLVSQGADWLYGYDPATGEELWKARYGQLGFSISSRAVFAGDRMYLSTGYSRPELQCWQLGGSEPRKLWSYAKGVPTMSSPLLVGNELYFVSDSGGMWTCLDARTGTEHHRERLGGNHSASPLFADGHIYIPNREGITSVLKPGPKFERIAENPLPGKIMASPVAVGDSLYLRTDTVLYRIGNASR
jgi:outer membrane protein assembly factor BamB